MSHQQDLIKIVKALEFHPELELLAVTTIENSPVVDDSTYEFLQKLKDINDEINKIYEQYYQDEQKAYEQFALDIKKIAEEQSIEDIKTLTEELNKATAELQGINKELEAAIQQEAQVQQVTPVVQSPVSEPTQLNTPMATQQPQTLPTPQAGL